MKTVLKVLGVLFVVGLIAGGGVFYKMTNLNRDANEKTVGVKAPTIALTGIDGRAIALADITKKGTPVLVFYRGAW